MIINASPENASTHHVCRCAMLIIAMFTGGCPGDCNDQDGGASCGAGSHRQRYPGEPNSCNRSSQLPKRSLCLTFSLDMSLFWGQCMKFPFSIFFFGLMPLRFVLIHVSNLDLVFLSFGVNSLPCSHYHVFCLSFNMS